MPCVSVRESIEEASKSVRRSYLSFSVMLLPLQSRSNDGKSDDERVSKPFHQLVYLHMVTALLRVSQWSYLKSESKR